MVFLSSWCLLAGAIAAIGFECLIVKGNDAHLSISSKSLDSLNNDHDIIDYEERIRRLSGYYEYDNNYREDKQKYNKLDSDSGSRGFKSASKSNSKSKSKSSSKPSSKSGSIDSSSGQRSSDSNSKSGSTSSSNSKYKSGSKSNSGSGSESSSNNRDSSDYSKIRKYGNTYNNWYGSGSKSNSKSVSSSKSKSKSNSKSDSKSVSGSRDSSSSTSSNNHAHDSSSRGLFNNKCKYWWNKWLKACRSIESKDDEDKENELESKEFYSIRLNCGNDGYDDTDDSYYYIDSNGNKWISDDKYCNSKEIEKGSKDLDIDDTNDDEIYRNSRFIGGEDNLVYTFNDINNGIYKIKLHFAEIFFDSEGDRTFDILINDKEKDFNIDILFFVDKNTALILEYKNIEIKYNKLEIKFRKGANDPKVSGIEIDQIE